MTAARGLISDLRLAQFDTDRNRVSDTPPEDNRQLGAGDTLRFIPDASSRCLVR